MNKLNRLSLVVALGVGTVLSLGGEPFGHAAPSKDPKPTLRLAGSYLIGGSGILRGGEYPNEYAKTHAGTTGDLETDGEGNASIVFYTGATDSFGLTDGFISTKDCTYVEGNPGPQAGRLLCTGENAITKVVLGARYTITRSGEKAVAVGVLLVYDKDSTGETLVDRADVTFELERHDM